MVPLILGGLATFFGGAYIGTVVDNATQKESVVINTEQTTTNPAGISTKKLLTAGLLGIGAFIIYKKFLKGR